MKLIQECVNGNIDQAISNSLTANELFTNSRQMDDIEANAIANCLKEASKKAPEGAFTEIFDENGKVIKVKIDFSKLWA